MRKNLTWTELKATKSGTVLHNEFSDGVRFIVMRGPGSLTAYVGVPKDHPLAGMDYDSLPRIDCHGGLTYSGIGKEWPKGFYWYGWDYAHSGDCAFYYDDLAPIFKGSDKKWLVEDVIEDSYWAIQAFKKIVTLVEKITACK